MGVIPYVGLVKPTDKIPVGSYIEDIEEMHRKTVDPVTGRLFMKHSLQDDIRVRQQRQRDFLDQKVDHIEGAEEVAEQLKTKAGQEDIMLGEIMREMSIDAETRSTLPDRETRKWMAAQANVTIMNGEMVSK